MKFGDGGKWPVCVENVKAAKCVETEGNALCQSVLRFACGRSKAGPCVDDSDGNLRIPSLLCVLTRREALCCARARHALCSACRDGTVRFAEAYVYVARILGSRGERRGEPGRALCCAVSFTMRASVSVQFFSASAVALLFVSASCVPMHVPLGSSRFLRSVARAERPEFENGRWEAFAF